jgi:hypothetical protein
MTMQRFSFVKVLFACSLAASAVPAVAAASPSATHEAEKAVRSLAELPEGLRAALAAASPGNMSDRGGPFNPGCVIRSDVPSQRFVSARVQLDEAVVAVEHGGIAHHVENVKFKREAGRWQAVR